MRSNGAPGARARALPRRDERDDPGPVLERQRDPRVLPEDDDVTNLAPEGNRSRLSSRADAVGSDREERRPRAQRTAHVHNDVAPKPQNSSEPFSDHLHRLHADEIVRRRLLPASLGGSGRAPPPRSCGRSFLLAPLPHRATRVRSAAVSRCPCLVARRYQPALNRPSQRLWGAATQRGRSVVTYSPAWPRPPGRHG
jgi:hypothetical protein